MVRSLSVVSGLICLILIHCTYSPFTTVHSRMTMENARVVSVLNFEQEGLGGDKTGCFAADELTAALFMNKKIMVVDRSHVQTVMQKNDYSGSILEVKDIKQLGKLLDTDFIILGKLSRLTGTTPIPEADQKSTIQIVFRILAVRDGSVIGIVECEECCKKDIQTCIKAMLWKMADRVEIRK